MENGNGKGHGGARVGAGRKPKALVYREEVTAAETRIVDGLPKLIEKLMELAMDGNVGALKYLVDRILGRVPVLAAAPAEDTALRYVEKDFQHDLVGHLLRAQLKKRNRDERMWELDLTGTELESEFEADVEEEEFNMDGGDVKEEQESELNKEQEKDIHMDGRDTQVVQDGTGELNGNDTGEDNEKEENLAGIGGLEASGDRTGSTGGVGEEKVEDANSDEPDEEVGEIDPSHSVEEKTAAAGDVNGPAANDAPAGPLQYGRRYGYLPGSGRLRFSNWPG